MSHDLIAELAGYQAELARYEVQNRDDRVQAVAGEVGRVVRGIVVEIEKLLAQAENHEEAGQDVLAAQCRVQAKAYARALPEEHRPASLRPLYGAAPAEENAAGPGPRETATTRRGRATAEKEG